MRNCHQTSQRCVVTALATLCWIAQPAPASSETEIPHELEEGLQAFTTAFRSHDRPDQKAYFCGAASKKEWGTPCIAFVECGYLELALQEGKPTLVHFESGFEWANRPHCTEQLFVTQLASAIKNILKIEQSTADLNVADFREHASGVIARKTLIGSYYVYSYSDSKIKTSGRILPFAEGRGHMSVAHDDVDPLLVSRDFHWGTGDHLNDAENWLGRMN